MTSELQVVDSTSSHRFLACVIHMNAIAPNRKTVKLAAHMSTAHVIDFSIAIAFAA
jgi:hypothetical protein